MFWGEKPKYLISKTEAALLEQIAEAISERFQGLDAEVKALQDRCAALEADIHKMTHKPHQSLKAKLRNKT